MLRAYLARRFAKPGANDAPAAAADEPDYIEGQDYDYNLNRNAGSAGFGIATGDLYINRRGFLTQKTSDGLHSLLNDSHSDARASLERIVRWKQPLDKHGKPEAMRAEDCKDYAADVDRVIKYIATRQRPLVLGEKGLGKIFFTNLSKAMKEHKTQDPLAVLEHFETLPNAVREHFSATERDALGFEQIRADVIPIAREYVQLQQLSLALRDEASKVLGDAMQPKPVRPEPMGCRSSGGFMAKEKPRAGMNGGSGVIVHNGHRSGNSTTYQR